MKLTRSFIHAWHGIQHCYTTQMNFRIHILVMMLAIVAGFVLKISNTEWLFVIICLMLVLALELMNTAIEHLGDMVTIELHPVIKIIKDVSAGAVLIGATGSVVTGLLIFLPKIIGLFN